MSEKYITKKQHSNNKIEISYNSYSDLEKLGSLEEFKANLYPIVLYILEQAILDNSKMVELFNISNLNLKVNIKREEFKGPLNVILKYYEIQEDYYSCTKIRNLIEKI